MLFHFSQYSSLLLLGFLHGMIFFFLLLWRGFQENRSSDKLLAVLLLICCLHISQYMLGFGGWYDSRDFHSTFMFYFPFHHILLLGPIIYFYFLSLSNTHFKLTRQHWKHFIPGGIMVFVFLLMIGWDLVIQHWVLGHQMPFHYGTQGAFSTYYQQHLAGIFQDLAYSSLIIYLYLTVSIYRKYRDYINEHFSNTEEFEFGWLRNVLYAIIMVIAFGFCIDIIDQYIYNLNYDQYWVAYFGVVVFIYFISISGYNGTRKIPLQLNFIPNAVKMPKEEELQENTAHLSPWKEKINRLMATEVFLDPSLSLQDLAAQLQTNPSILSKVINSGFGMNFNDFINSYRVEAVKIKLQQGVHEQLTLTSIAYDCGFNSKATFNRAFKKFTEKSPRDYLLQLEKESLTLVNK